MQYNYNISRITLNDDSHQLIGEILFPTINNDIVLLEHVFINPTFEQQGFGSLLVAEFVKHAIHQKLTVKLLDPFAKLEFAKHPEYQQLLINE
ncbi:hypothetical protein FC70_GL000249 [Paucilactobacillus oligofermentans DSM 15707 = LMG 22743]|uniref:N-acetyltransferase domain-containing protein n=1 Tax=Paucilactobacillus oligofermentans DSM 15707 = LMG 22743 TaxID=1423778 RepID=A0A0R1RU83_9LACO|nr:GNAT family N-acetyltransferase [Paucilactobacillus oligofermentans]KRL57778.1 hypothetical protein FC70_GL000249 [Paucilactobacillus oligofermentans DSM 15707 = LMG 22743]CUS26770.1 Uncharacterized protein YjdJ [Paucilactobacillus oligofermentans DSM 15707 = LMG 22743]